jgi:hypothetical protein
MILETTKKTNNKIILEEIFLLLSNVLSLRDSSIIFSFLNYDYIQILIKIIFDNCNNCDILINLYVINLLKLIFEIENSYKMNEEKNYNFNDNYTNYIDYFMKNGGLEVLAMLGNKGNINLDKYIDEIENQIRISIMNKNLN